MTGRSPTTHADTPPIQRLLGDRTRWALVVDRNPLLRDSVRLYLETMGWRATAAATLDDALPPMAERPDPSPVPAPAMPALIVMGEDGRAGAAPSVMARLAALSHGERPVLLSIAETNRDLMRRARDQGFVAIHPNLLPLDLEALLRDSIRRIESA
ncbi:hypothetical protein [Azospirillum sp. TSO35-2]|uniref:hypothetical protein n=1 Tax=Azospirillum sp. TSO35-2 TaxID=716796 RepID=UPI000D6158DC|nr:hypothetical protein [Azospirillum sp. TSO35-2]PWC40909.1 hypothetical protein TSO352_00180 [Azospirillum sp. TSO35-2]